jgi:hypothetical protein
MAAALSHTMAWVNQAAIADTLPREEGGPVFLASDKRWRKLLSRPDSLVRKNFV